MGPSGDRPQWAEIVSVEAFSPLEPRPPGRSPGFDNEA